MSRGSLLDDAPPPQRRATPAPGVWLLGLLLAAVLGTLLFLAGYLFAGGTQSPSGCSAPSEAFAPLCEIYDTLKTQYVDPLEDSRLVDGAVAGMREAAADAGSAVSDEQLADAAIRGMLTAVGDSYTSYMSPDEFQSNLSDLSGTFEGIGAEMAVKNVEEPDASGQCQELDEVCVIIVVAPIAGSPAEAAGLLAGDIVRSVDGTSVVGSTLSEQVQRIRGPAGTRVTLGIEREGEPLELTITRAEIVIQQVEARMLQDAVGYIRLNRFSDSSVGEFREALRALLDDGARQIVFDLRNNPGGYIVAAQEIASQFLDGGTVFIQDGAGDQVKTWEVTGGGLVTDPAIDVVVLTNGGSASASEIVAAALQERGRATVVGETTFGKNTVQLWTELRNRGGLSVTISRWFTPDRASVEGRGVEPDIAVEVPSDTPPDRDPILERALRFLEEQSEAGLAGAA
jgi:carboxyl-terminal processing protease